MYYHLICQAYRDVNVIISYIICILFFVLRQSDNNGKVYFVFDVYNFWQHTVDTEGRLGRDRMVVRFTTTYAINAYHH